MNKHEQYWHDVSLQFSNPDTVVDISVQDATVYNYLQTELDTMYRHVVSAGKCQRQYNTVRMSYEKSKSVINYKHSGQGNPNFFPAFCDDNPVHVYFHYLMRDDTEKTGNGDLSLAVFSMMDPRMETREQHAHARRECGISFRNNRRGRRRPVVIGQPTGNLP